MKANLSPTIQKIIKEYEFKFGYNRTRSAFLTDKLQEVERDAKEAAIQLGVIQERSRQDTVKIVNKPFNKEKFIKDAREVKKTFEEEKITDDDVWKGLGEGLRDLKNAK